MEQALTDSETAATGQHRAIPSWAYPLAVALILLLAFAIRVYRLEHQSIWWDESYSIFTSQQSLGKILSDTAAADEHPPLHYIMMHYWMKVTGTGEFGVRFLSVIGGMALVALAIRAGRTMASRGVALTAGLLAAVFPTWVAYSQEARMYAFSVPLSLGSAYLLYIIVRRSQSEGNRHPWTLWGGYLVVTALAMYTNYLTLYVVLFENLYAAVAILLPALRQHEGSGRKWKTLQLWVLAEVALLALYIPRVLIALSHGIYGSESRFVNLTFAKPPPLLSRLVSIWRGITVGRQEATADDVITMAVVGALLLVGLLAAWLQSRQHAKLLRRSIPFLSLYLLVTVASILVSIQFRPIPLHPRYSLMATPPLLLLLAIAIERLRRLWIPLGLAAGGMAVTLLTLSTEGYMFDPDQAKPDARSFVHYLNRQVTADDLVLWATPHPFDYYYRGAAPAHWLHGTPEAISNELAELANGRKRVFWATWTPFPKDPWGIIPYLLATQSSSSQSMDWRGYNFMRYDLRPEAAIPPIRLEPASLNFDNQIALIGLDVEQAEKSLTSSGTLGIALRWQSLTSLNKTFKFYVHLIDEKGHLLGQYDALLYDDREGITRYWADGDTGWSFATIRPFTGAPPGNYRLELGVYDEKGMKPLPVLGLTAPPILAKVHIERPATPPAIADFTMQKPLGQDFGNLRLLGYSLAGSSGEPLPGLSAQQGQILHLTLFWQATAKPSSDQAFCLRLLDATGQTRGEQCDQPAAGRYPTSQWQPGEIVRDIREFIIPPDAPNGDLSFAVASAAGEAPLASVRLTDRARTFTTPTIGRPMQLLLGKEIELLGYDVASRGNASAPDGEALAVAPGDTIELTLYWRAKARIPTAYTVFTHILDEDGGKVLAQTDSPPLGGKAPTTSWEQGEVITDRYLLAVDKATPPGAYPLEVGMYDPLTMKRAVTGSEGDRILLDKVKVR